MTETMIEIKDYETRLIDELNELIECWLCPMDLMDTIDGYVALKIINELELMKKENISISDKLKELTEI
jgi:hypothetical protein|tara:strand:+ start:247 stop:453 length:207 start_codon:yes stop_codon:yes gene_type:complete